MHLAIVSPFPPTITGIGQYGYHVTRAIVNTEAFSRVTVLNCRTRDLLNQNSPSLTFLPSEDVSQWPENLRRKMERGEVAREDEKRDV